MLSYAGIDVNCIVKNNLHRDCLGLQKMNYLQTQPRKAHNLRDIVYISR